MKSNLARPSSLLGLVIVTGAVAMAQDSEPAAPTPPPPPPPPVADPALPDPPPVSTGTRNTVILKKKPLLAEANELAVQANLVRAGEELGALQSRLGRGGRTLVVPTTSPDPKRLAETEEDLNVMARILEKAAGAKRSKGGHAMGIPVDITVFGSPAPLRNLYIEGHGALFFLNVPFPLVPPPEKKDSEEKPAKPEDSEWESARRELYGADSGRGFVVDVLREVRMSLGDAPQEYDTNKVEKLKRELVEALMNATHIRQLKPDETVTVVVSGPGGAAGPEKMVRRRVQSTSGFGGYGGFGGGAGGGGVVVASSDDHPPHPQTGGSVMVIRARKSDAEAFYQGQSDFDAFLKKVTVLLY